MIKAKSLPNNKEQIEFSPIFKSYFFLILSQPEITMEVTPPDSSWNLWQKLSFRFFFIFFGLIIFPFPLTIIPGIGSITEPINKLWTALINFSGKTFFGVEENIAISFTGSGDKLYDWLWYFSILLLTLILGISWSVLDQKRLNYTKLKAWFVLILTYYLAYFLFVYGIIKLFYLQFSAPSLERLFQTYGQSSPMRLAWTFMGASKTYTVFSGFCETLAGALLLFGRTRTLGALTAVGVMLNVFMLNMSYDIPVKLFSFQLMIIGFYIAAQDFDRLFSFFFLRKAIPEKKITPPVSSRRGKIILLIFQVIFAGYIIIMQVSNSNSSRKQYGEKREKSALYGVYNVENFVLNNDTLPPLLTDTSRWKRILFDYPNFTSIMLMDDKVTRYDSEIDTLAQSIIFSPRGDTINQYEFKYTLDEQDMQLSGVLKDDTLKIDLNYYDIKRFGLFSRGFHWINEVPYNRYNYD